MAESWCQLLVHVLFWWHFVLCRVPELVWLKRATCGPMLYSIILFGDVGQLSTKPALSYAYCSHSSNSYSPTLTSALAHFNFKWDWFVIAQPIIDRYLVSMITNFSHYSAFIFIQLLCLFLH